MDENRTLNISSLLDQINFLMLFIGYTVIAYGIGCILNKAIKSPSLINKHLFRWIIGLIPIVLLHFLID